MKKLNISEKTKFQIRLLVSNPNNMETNIVTLINSLCTDNNIPLLNNSEIIFDFSDTNIKNIFFISKLQRLKQEISINKDIVEQEKILSEKDENKLRKTKEHNKEDLAR